MPTEPHDTGFRVATLGIDLTTRIRDSGKSISATRNEIERAQFLDLTLTE